MWAVPATAGAKYDPFGDVPKRGRGSARQIFGEPFASSFGAQGARLLFGASLSEVTRLPRVCGLSLIKDFHCPGGCEGGRQTPLQAV